MYSQRLLERFHSATRAGDLSAPSGVALKGNPTCGDVVQIGIEVSDDGWITDARFRTLGCAVAIAASDAVCDLVVGRTMAAAAVLGPDEIAEALGGIPQQRAGCAAAPVEALRSALYRIR